MEQLNLLNDKTKTEIAIEFIQDHEPEEGYFVGFSGGKDSQVLYKLTEMAGVKCMASYRRFLPKDNHGKKENIFI